MNTIFNLNKEKSGSIGEIPILLPGAGQPNFGYGFQSCSIGEHGATARINGQFVEASVDEDGEFYGTCSCGSNSCLHIQALSNHLESWAEENRHRHRKSDLMFSLLRRSR